MSFKTYNLGDVERALSDQVKVKLCLTKSFIGSTEITNGVVNLSGRAALEAAKKMQNSKKASLQSQLVIDVGEETELLDNVNSYGIQFLRIQQIELYGKSPIYKIYDNVTKRQIYDSFDMSFLFLLACMLIFLKALRNVTPRFPSQ